MKSLNDLVSKCWDNNLSIEIVPHRSGAVRVIHWLEEFDEEGYRELMNVTGGYLKDWPHESPEDASNRMHEEVDAYLNRISVPFMDEHETEHAQATLTEQERKMKEETCHES